MRTILPILVTATLALAGCGRAQNVVIEQETVDAESLLDAALAKATVEDKVVFVHLSAPGWGWCQVLEEFLDKNEALFAEDLIHLKIDTVEMEKGDDVAKRLRGEGAAGGIPWSVILNADGDELITSDGPEGNIGYPMNEAEINYFMEMLRVARPGMNADKGAAIREALERYAETREF